MQEKQQKELEEKPETPQWIMNCYMLKWIENYRLSSLLVEVQAVLPPCSRTISNDIVSYTCPENRVKKRKRNL